MPIQRKIRLMSVAVLAMAGATLAVPAKSVAAVPDAQCGVCYTDNLCPSSQYRDDQCYAFCGTFVASDCTGGIPGGWTCQGHGVYQNFWQCG